MLHPFGEPQNKLIITQERVVYNITYYLDIYDKSRFKK
jgi:hypothetical protein